MNKKASFTIIILVIVIVIFSGVIFYELVTRDCNSNEECAEDSYCSHNYECVQYPPEVLVTKQNFVLPAIILSVAIIVAAFILKKKRVKKVQL
jgi:hypothetical protein